MSDDTDNKNTVDNLINLAEWRKKTHEAVKIEDFVAYLPQHNYIYMPTREPWPASSVNARVPPVPTGKINSEGKAITVPANAWLDQNQSVEQMTWYPGESELIEDRLISNGGWIERYGATCLNLYLPPILKAGDPNKAGPWVDHVHKVYPDDADHIIKWTAQRVQQPQIKVNHVLVLGGAPGIGKDTMLEPIKHAIGPWNFSEVSPQQMLGRFNGFVKAVIVRVSEARDLGEVDRYSFYEHMKVYAAAPPDVVRVDEKNLREHSVLNCCGIVVTTNYRTDGIYLPADDRRHFVAWSTRAKDDFAPEYWKTLWGWYAQGGIGHVAAYLTKLDLSTFDPKGPPPKTPAFWDIVDANRAPEDAELADALDTLKQPKAITLEEIRNVASAEFGVWLGDRKNRRAIPHRMEQVGYVPIRNGTAKDGLWKIGNRRQAVYARVELSLRDQHAAATSLVARFGST
jgi:Family of unknown function (DUF5906)